MLHCPKCGKGYNYARGSSCPECKCKLRKLEPLNRADAALVQARLRQQNLNHERAIDCIGRAVEALVNHGFPVKAAVSLVLTQRKAQGLAL